MTSISSDKRVSLDEIGEEVRRFQVALDNRHPELPYWRSYVEERIESLYRLLTNVENFGWRAEPKTVKVVADAFAVARLTTPPIGFKVPEVMAREFEEKKDELFNQIQEDNGGRGIGSLPDDTLLSQKASVLFDELSQLQRKIFARTVI